MMDISIFLNECVEGHDKELALTHLSVLQLCRENSVFSGVLSEMVEYCVCKSEGNDKCSIEAFVKLLNNRIERAVYSIPTQEYLFVDCVHAIKETFKIFPGQYCNFQNAVSRLFNFFREHKTRNDAVNMALVLLSISDTIASSLSLSRYEKGVPDNTAIFVPAGDYYHHLQETVFLKKDYIVKVLKKYGCNIENFEQLILNGEEIEDSTKFACDLSMIERHPFLQLDNGNYLLLQPSALLSSAYYILLSLFQEEMKENWYELYKIEVLQELLRTKALFDYGYMGMGEADEQPSLLYRVDKDKILCIQTILNPATFEAYRLFNEGMSRYMKQKYPKCKSNIVLAIDVIGMHGSCYNSGENDIVMLPVDDLEVILNANDFSPLDLWYYAEDKKNSIIKYSAQEIDLFAFYYNNQRSFYCNVPQRPTSAFSVAIGNALQLRYSNSREEDLHFLDLGYTNLFIERFRDISPNLPIYVPYRDASKTVYIGEYRRGKLVCSVKNDSSSERLKEIAKSIILWIYCIEYKNNLCLLYENVTIGLSFYMDKIYKVEREEVKGQFVIFKYYIPYSEANDFTQNDLEKKILYNLLDRLHDCNIQMNLDYRFIIEHTFNICRGHIYQGTNQLDILLNPDDGTDIYYLNKRCNDKLLHDISTDILTGYKRNVLLSVTESKNTAILIQNYIERKLNALLAMVANEELLIELLKLHHAFQYWKELGRARFVGINDFLSNIDEKYENQVSSAISYSEGDNATCYIIELIIRKGFGSPHAEVPSYDDFNMIFSYVAQLYNIGMYLDVLSVRKEKAKLKILESGRFCFPLQEMELYEHYFLELREEEFNKSRIYRKRLDNLPEFDVNTKKTSFVKAFISEYGIEYKTLNSIIVKCMKYSLAQNKAVCIMSEDQFVKTFFEHNFNYYNAFKKHFFLSKMVSKGLKYSEFYPHRHNRLFQISTRPWILYNGKVMYSYKSLFISYSIFLERLSNGILRASSTEMKAFMGSVREEKGQKFNLQMFHLFLDLDIKWLKVFQGVNIGKGETLENETPIGDIDLLLIDTCSGKIVCVELKNYVESRSLWSVMTQERETQDDIKKVIRRDEWCQKNIHLFKKLAHIDNDKECVLRTVFLTYNLQAHKYFIADGTTDANLVFLEVSQILDSPLDIFKVFDN